MEADNYRPAVENMLLRAELAKVAPRRVYEMTQYQIGGDPLRPAATSTRGEARNREDR